MNAKLHYCEPGYAPSSSKTFLIAFSEDVSLASVKFKILNTSSNCVFEGVAEKLGRCDYTGEFLYKGDFSSVTALGLYRIVLEGLNVTSHEFQISGEWLARETRANIKSFYYQRSGVELPAKFAGAWARPAAHLDSALEFHPTMNRSGVWNAHGGWYDAGDYGKYIVNGGVSVATLMLACELRKTSEFVGGAAFKESFEQPVSLLDEIRFELEFFLRMQDDDGGVFFKVTPYRWDGFVTPAESDASQKRYILGKSTSSTLNFVGALAQAYCLYTDVDADFAAECLKASVRAYLWAEQNPEVDWPHNTEGSGGYGDPDLGDDFFWARAMLYRALVAENADKIVGGVAAELIERIEKQLPADMEAFLPTYGLQWRSTQNLAWFALATMDCKWTEKARKAFMYTAEEILKLQNEDPYSLSIRKFIWGSNGDIANHALTLYLAYEWFKEPKYCKAAMEQIEFIYGRNPVDVSFVTGSSWNSPKFPHHRISHSDGVVKPVPGLVVGGINVDRQDAHRNPHYLGDAPGMSYADEQCSFASNEVAINWSAPLTAALLLLSA
ncbi:glycoside hydrolase family 9 protein [Fibrobacter sp. UWB12]|uniref:glycoside hydrolase family 9 protein n=1 Tax=Fibrobacter sp. UWB12 TaxID=1896203 RepID=UPI000913596B|nr:glycoside hydrolase family 9 protein [Fibrobacter sp. UWB12]SHK59831.1 endoglucanase [Fibrobacter sp. UWB12]